MQEEERDKTRTVTVGLTSDVYASSSVEDDAMLRFRCTKFKLQQALLTVLLTTFVEGIVDVFPPVQCTVDGGSKVHH